MESARVGKRGAIIVPARLRKRFGIEEGSIVVAEETDEGILIRPAVLVPVERYTPERKAEFYFPKPLDADYRKARKMVRRLGLDPDRFSIGDRDKWTGCFWTRTFCFLRPIVPGPVCSNCGDLRV